MENSQNKIKLCRKYVKSGIDFDVSAYANKSGLNV